MFRQAFGRAILSQVSHDQDNEKEKVARKLSSALLLLLPKPLDLSPMIMRIMDRAVTLANEMVTEQCLFQCFMVKTGTKSNERIRVEDINQTGPVLLCTFPGFGKTVRDGEKETFVCLVKATVDLDSAFAKKES